MKILLLLISFALPINLIAQNDSTLKKDKTPYIKVIGHSWAVGAFTGQEKYFEDNGIRIDETSKVGTSLIWAVEEIKKVPPKKYDAICLLSGINDFQSSPDVAATQFSEFFEIAFSKANTIFVYNIPYYEPAKEFVSIMNEWLNETAKINNGIIIIDIYSEIELQKKEGLEMDPSGLHPRSYDSIQDILIYMVKYYYNLL